MELIQSIEVDLVMCYASGNYVYISNIAVNSFYELIKIEIRDWLKHLCCINYIHSNPQNFKLKKFVYPRYGYLRI
jgi:hypothetical protein